MLTLADLDRLARVETVHLDQHSEHNCTWEQWRELVEAATALRLLQEAGERWERRTFGGACGWLCGDNGDLLSGERGSDYPHATPQAAVIAALKGAKT